MVDLHNSATLKKAGSTADAGRTFASLNTTALSNHKVDGSKNPDTTGPTLESAAVDGTDLKLMTWSAALGGGSTVHSGAFTVNVAGSERGTTTALNVQGKVLTLTLASAVRPSETVTVSYDKSLAAPGSRVRDAAGNEAANVTNRAVTNNTGAVALTDQGSGCGTNGTAWVRLDVGDDGNLANSQKLTFVAPGSASGSGTATLRFEYTVVAADTDADGVWVQTTSATDLTVVIASGEFSVKSVAHPTVDAELTKSGLPTSGDPNHKVHGNWPRVTDWLGVSSPETGDTYGVGEQFLIRAAFNTNVTVTGAPQLEIAVGTNARQVEYSTGSGTNMPTFAYTVVPGDLDADGISIAANSLTLNGGTITDTDGRAALLSHAAIPDNPGHKVYGGPLDLTGPALDSVTVDGVTLVLTYDEPLRGPAPAARAFTVRVDRRSRTVDSVELAGNALTLTLASAVDDDSTVTVSYRASRAGGNPVQDP